MENILIIYCHPYDQSFNHAIKEALENKLGQAEKHFTTVDLYAENFNPVYDAMELSLFKTGETKDPLVKKYQELLLDCTNIIAIFPVWWSDVPGMMKGFFDKVMKMNFAYQPGKSGVVGLLGHIKTFTVISTSTSPTWYLKLFCGNAIQTVFLNAAVKQIGIKKRRWINFGNMDNKTESDREQFLAALDLAKLVGE